MCVHVCVCMCVCVCVCARHQPHASLSPQCSLGVCVGKYVRVCVRVCVRARVYACVWGYETHTHLGVFMIYAFYTCRLQCVAVCCSVLQCACSVLQCVAKRFSVLQCVAVQY